MAYTDDIKLLEYSSLRDEMLQNKKYIFERPLLILGAIGIVAIQVENVISVLIFLPFLLNVVLLINLWFTVNRLKSSARIASYIDIVLEPGNNLEYIGWEKSLRKYRIWNRNLVEDKQKVKLKYYNSSAVPDAIMFYPPLYYLHIVIVGLSFVTSVIWAIGNPETYQYIGVIANVIITIVFIYYCVRPYHPNGVKGLIEDYRSTWMAVFLG